MAPLGSSPARVAPHSRQKVDDYLKQHDVQQRLQDALQAVVSSPTLPRDPIETIAKLLVAKPTLPSKADIAAMADPISLLFDKYAGADMKMSPAELKQCMSAVTMQKLGPAPVALSSAFAKGDLDMSGTYVSCETLEGCPHATPARAPPLSRISRPTAPIHPLSRCVHRLSMAEFKAVFTSLYATKSKPGLVASARQTTEDGAIPSKGEISAMADPLSLLFKKYAGTDGKMTIDELQVLVRSLGNPDATALSAAPFTGSDGGGLSKAEFRAVFNKMGMGGAKRPAKAAGLSV